MRDHPWRLDPLQPVIGQGQGAEERRGDRHRMHRRAQVVREARQRQLAGARAATNRLVGFEDDDLPSGLSHDDGRRQTIRPGADDDRIRSRGHARI
jgi:hypothetical protein